MEGKAVAVCLVAQTPDLLLLFHDFLRTSQSVALGVGGKREVPRFLRGLMRHGDRILTEWKARDRRA